MTPTLLTIPQASSALGVSRSTIYRLIASGHLRSVQVRGCRRIASRDLDRYVHDLQRQHIDQQACWQAGQR